MARGTTKKQKGAAPKRQPETQTVYAWVIEHENSPVSAPLYFGGRGMDDFSRDHMKALRFQRRADAEQVADGLLRFTPTRVAEHGWDE